MSLPSHLEPEFWIVCANEILEEVKKHKNPTDLNKAFAWACSGGNLEVAQYLIQRFPDINPHIDNEWPFRMACSGGFLKVVMWFVETFPETNVHADNDFALYVAQENQQKETVAWFLRTYPESKKILKIKEWISSQESKLSWILSKIDLTPKVGKLMINVEEAQYIERLPELLTPYSHKQFEKVMKERR